jgi:hypothetical protein
MMADQDKLLRKQLMEMSLFKSKDNIFHSNQKNIQQSNIFKDTHILSD